MDTSMGKQLFMNGKSFIQIAHIMIFHSRAPSCHVINKTYDKGTKTSHDVITLTPEKAFFSKDGQDLNDPDWDKIEG